MKKIIAALNYVEDAVLAGGLLALAIMSFIEVCTRYIFGYSFTWFEELSRYAAVLFTFMGASLGFKYGLHFSMDFFITHSRPRVARLLLITGNLITAILFIIVAYYAIGHVAKMYRFGTTSAAMRLPMWIAYLPIAVFSLGIVSRVLLQVAKHAQGFIKNAPLTTEDSTPATAAEEEAAK